MYDLARTIVQFPAPGSQTIGDATSGQSGGRLVYSPIKPCRVIRWGVICTTTINDNSHALKLTCDLWPTAGVNTNAVAGATTLVAAQSGYNASNAPAFYYDASGGSMTFTASTAQLTAGALAYHNVFPQKAQTGGYYPAPDTAFIPPGGVDTQFVVYPGQSVAIVLAATAPTAGKLIYWLEIAEQPFVAADNVNLGATTYPLPSSIVPTPSMPGIVGSTAGGIFLVNS